MFQKKSIQKIIGDMGEVCAQKITFPNEMALGYWSQTCSMVQAFGTQQANSLVFSAYDKVKRMYRVKAPRKDREVAYAIPVQAQGLPTFVGEIYYDDLSPKAAMAAALLAASYHNRQVDMATMLYLLNKKDSKAYKINTDSIFMKNLIRDHAYDYAGRFTDGYTWG